MSKKEIAKYLLKFDTIQLTEMDGVQLMNRVDTKFAFSEEYLPGFLESLSADYRVLEVEGNSVSSYESVYYDDAEFVFYNDHHRQKSSRYKVRKRKYVESDISFLEIKHKVNGRTDKTRIPVPDLNERLDETNVQFIQNAGLDHELHPVLVNNFNRVTLVMKGFEERLTLDLNLLFKWKGKEFKVENVVIAELKQGRKNRQSPFYAMMKSNQIRPIKISKYCVGLISIYGKNNIKYNRFKSKLLTLTKLQKYAD